jgi:hypothetical protein
MAFHAFHTLSFPYPVISMACFGMGVRNSKLAEAPIFHATTHDLPEPESTAASMTKLTALASTLNVPQSMWSGGVEVRGVQ